MSYLGQLIVLSPILVLVLGIFLFKGKTLQVAGAAFFVAILVGRYYWQMFDHALAGSLIKALFISLDISLIIFGALMFLEFMRKHRVLHSIILYLYELSNDLRIQFIFIGWLFGAFIEGTAGFGVPGLLISPLLIGLGLTPVQAVSLALLSNTVPVTFGAAGTPIRIGFFDFESFPIALDVGFFGALISIVWPLVLLLVLTIFLKRRPRYFWSGIPVALLSGLAFAVPYYITSRYSLDLPTIIGALSAILIVGFFVRITRKDDFVAVLTDKVREALEVTRIDERLPFYKTAIPYVLLIIFIIGLRALPVMEIAANITFLNDFQHTFMLFNPGIPFLLALLGSFLLFKPKKKDFKNIFNIVLPKLIRTALLIFLITGIMQIVINSGLNIRGSPPMIPYLLGETLPSGSYYLVPFLGAFGSFLSGSATVSNILFGNITASIFTEASIPIATLLAMQLIGAAGGNMLSLQNIVTGQLTAGPIENEEVPIIKAILPWFLIYIGLCLGLLFFLVL